MFLTIIGIILALYGIAMIVVMVQGHIRGKIVIEHLSRFGKIYVNDFEETGSKEVALINAFRVFSTCPKIRELQPMEIKAAIMVLLDAPSPKKIVDNVVFRMPAMKALQAFRDTRFLRQLVEKEIKAIRF